MSKEAALAIATNQPGTTTSDIAVVGPSEPVKHPDPDSARFASLAKKEAEYVKRQQALKAEQEKFGAERSQVQEILKRRDAFEEAMKVDRITAFKMLGFSEEDLFKIATQEKKEPTPEERAEAVASKIVEERLAAAKKEQEDKLLAETKARDAQLLTEYKASIGSLIEANKDKYEYCSHFGPEAVDLAYRTTLQIVKDSKGADVPTPDEVIEMIEGIYEERDKELMSINKRKNWNRPQEETTKDQPERSRTVSTPPGATVPPAPIQRTRNLSNSARPTTASLERRVNETRDQKKERLKELIRTHGLTK